MRNDQETLRMWETSFPSKQHPHGVWGGARACMLPPSGWQSLGEVSRLHSLPSCRPRD